MAAGFETEMIPIICTLLANKSSTKVSYQRAYVRKGLEPTHRCRDRGQDDSVSQDVAEVARAPNLVVERDDLLAAEPLKVDRRRGL